MLRVVEPLDHDMAPVPVGRLQFESMAQKAGQSLQMWLPRHVHTDTELARGRVVEHARRPGFYFGAFDLEYLQDNRIDVSETSSVFCGLMLSGAPRTLGIAGYGDVEVRPGFPVIINFSAPTVCSGVYAGGTRCAGIGIRLTREFFDGGFSPTANDALWLLRALMDGDTIVSTLMGSPRLSALAHAALNGPHEGPLQALYLEGLAFAFLAEVCRLHEVEVPPPAAGLKLHEYRRVRQVADYLGNNLDRSMSLAALSRLAGINPTTLGRHFQAVYGETIFEYVRNRRLDHARSLLRDGNMPVSQVGYRVGFTSAAAFATAYRRRFGYPPSQELYPD